MAVICSLSTGSVITNVVFSTDLSHKIHTEYVQLSPKCFTRMFYHIVKHNSSKCNVSSFLQTGSHTGGSNTIKSRVHAPTYALAYTHTQARTHTHTNDMVHRKRIVGKVCTGKVCTGKVSVGKHTSTGRARARECMRSAHARGRPQSLPCPMHIHTAIHYTARCTARAVADLRLR